MTITEKAKEQARELATLAAQEMAIGQFEAAIRQAERAAKRK